MADNQTSAQKDMLEHIFALQHSFQQELIEHRHLEGISPQEWIQKQTLAMISELAELLDEVNFKWWKNPKPVDAHALKEELVDILHFFVSMCLSAGMDAKELYDIYLEKNKENILRQEGKGKKDGYDVSKME
ncbi:MAG: dUTPase [Clostridiales bacterium]|nr:dUTPase [Clostridiales bacterium]